MEDLIFTGPLFFEIFTTILMEVKTMAKVYIVRHTPIRGDDRFRAFDSLEKAKTHIESIPNIVESYPGYWECFFYGEQFENWKNMGIYTIHHCEVE